MKHTLFIKVSVEDEPPTKEARYFTSYGYLKFLSEKKSFLGEFASYVKPEWWLKEISIDLPDDEGISKEAFNYQNRDGDIDEIFSDGVKWLRSLIESQLKNNL